jgi:TetR/AcrR family transcriptional repressor of lmrAB and yxaGH operons
MQESTTRDRMIDTAARLFRRRGFHATSWRTLVEEGETPWGSAHHHFPGGKEQLGVAAIERGAAAMSATIAAALAAHRTVPEAVRAWCRVAAEALAASGFRDGCPVATVALETTPESKRLSAACQAAFEGWCAALAAALHAAGAKRKRAGELATIVVASVEGALLLARASRSTAPLTLVGEQLATTLAAEVAS